MNPAQVAYLEYLKSEHWQNLRLLALRRDAFQCSRCPETRHLEVHHRFYRRLWTDSVVDDLETLCSVCHEREHRPPAPSDPVFGVAGSKGATKWNVLGQKVTGNGVPIGFIIQKHKKKMKKRRKIARLKWLERKRRGNWSF